jgi:hypothetical protein
LGSGAIKITADDSSSGTTTILDSENEQLEIVDNGDNVFNNTIIAPINQLKFMDLIP